MKTDTPQTVYLKDYTRPPSGSTIRRSRFRHRTQPAALPSARRWPCAAAARPGQPLVSMARNCQTLAVSVDGQDWPYPKPRAR